LLLILRDLVGLRRGLQLQQGKHAPLAARTAGGQPKHREACRAWREIESVACDWKEGGEGDEA